MSEPLLIILATFLLVTYLSFDLYTGRYYYLLTARNKSSEGFIRWWAGKNAAFLVVMVIAYLLAILLFVLADAYEVPLNLTAVVVFCLLLAVMGLRNKLSSHKAGEIPPEPSLPRQFRRFWSNFQPRKKHYRRSSRRR